MKDQIKALSLSEPTAGLSSTALEPGGKQQAIQAHEGLPEPQTCVQCPEPEVPVTKLAKTPASHAQSPCTQVSCLPRTCTQVYVTPCNLEMSPTHVPRKAGREGDSISLMPHTWHIPDDLGVSVGLWRCPGWPDSVGDCAKAAQGFSFHTTWQHWAALLPWCSSGLNLIP